MKHLIIYILLLCTVCAKATDLNKVHKEVSTLVNHLHKVNGNFIRGEAPEVIIAEQKDAGAAYNPILHTLTVDLEIYNLCQSFGRQSMDALAFIIGHELAHCYMEHQDFARFNHYHQNEKTKKEPEKAADIYGLFNAYLAGYNSFQLVPGVIAKVYDAYELSDELSGYPSKQERMAIAQKVRQQVQELIDIYEAANYLSAIGQYDLAAASFQYILGYYQGRELYNNLGVNHALEALYFTAKDYDLYLFPLEIDWNTRIKKPKRDKGDRDLTPYEYEYRMKHLRVAKLFFEKAIEMDPAYFTADINMICVLTLMKRYQDAIDYHQRLVTSEKAIHYKIDESQKQSVQLAAAIAKSYLADQKEAAIRSLHQLSNSDHQHIAFQAVYNLKVAEEGIGTAAEHIRCFEPFPPPDFVDDVRLHRDLPLEMKFNLRENYEVVIDRRQRSIVFQYIEDGVVAFKFQLMQAPQTKLTRTLESGEKYKIIASTKGYFILCEDHRTVFYMTDDHRLNSWGRYY